MDEKITQILLTTDKKISKYKRLNKVDKNLHNMD